jgi:outer membrane biosynthesis protein TonB
MAPTPKSTKKEKTQTLPDENTKTESKSPKPVNEIEEIFQTTKSKKRKEKPSEETEQGQPEKKVKKDGKDKKGKKKKEKKSGPGRLLDDGPEAKARRRRTNDGFAIYSAEELGFGNTNAGGTPLCPFDCDCCF